MASPADSKPAQDKTHSFLILLYLVLLIPGTLAGLHVPKFQTWEVLNNQGDVIWSTTGTHALWTWWPDLTPDLCKLAGESSAWFPGPNLPELDETPCSRDSSSSGTLPIRIPSDQYGCSNQYTRANLRSAEFYVCPGQGQSRQLRRQCGGISNFYCASWGCETTGEASWNPSSSWDLIIVKKNNTNDPNCPQPCRNSYCNPLVIKFTEKGKQNRHWLQGNKWGLRLYALGKDPGLIFMIKLTLTTASTLAIGPNPVLTEPRQAQPRPQVLPQPTPSIPYSVPDSSPMSTPYPGTGDRLLQVLEGAFLTLNFSDPRKTQECWLCLSSAPPYYEGIAVAGDYSNYTSAPSTCSQSSRHKLTLPEVTGKGLCLGKVPHSHQALCNKTLTLYPGKYWLTGPNGTQWACNSGLTPCVSTTVLNQTNDFCVLVEVWPRVTYHHPSYIYSHYERMTRYPREPVSLTLALLLGGLTVGGITAGIGTGATALAETYQFRQLQQAMHTDLVALEESISALEKSLTSLSEVVLQNRRGLDILFLQEGGLCAALKEECCFYADHTGLVRDSMSKLRERLKQRQRLFESGQSWYERWFNGSPWFTTLVSSLLGPIIIILLILLFGPCILNRLVQFMKDRLSIIQAMVLTQQYHRLRQEMETEIE